MIQAFIREAPSELLEGREAVKKFTLDELRSSLVDLMLRPRPVVIFVYKENHSSILLKFLEDYTGDAVVIFFFEEIPKTIMSRVQIKRKRKESPVYGASDGFNKQVILEDPSLIYREMIAAGAMKLLPSYIKRGNYVLNYIDIIG